MGQVVHSITKAAVVRPDRRPDYHQMMVYPKMIGARAACARMARGLRTAPDMSPEIDALRDHLIEGYELAAKTSDPALLNELLQTLFLWANAFHQGRRVCRIVMY